MLIFVNKEETTMYELEALLSTEERVIELVDIDSNGNMYFEINSYGAYY